MKSVVAEQMRERPPGSEPALNPQLLLGIWVNTNPSPAFIRSIRVQPGPNGLLIQATGADAGLPRDWGETEAQQFAETPACDEAMALSAVFQLDGIEVRCQGYVVKGVLVIVSFTRVKDGRDRSSHFGKEFFYRVS